jgi:DNA mismatch repair protein MutS2
MSSKQIPPYDIRRACNALDWDFVIQSLEGHAASPVGKQRCRTLPFIDEAGLIRLALAETSEARTMIDQGLSVDLAGVSDINQMLRRVRARGVLETSELLRVADLLSASRRAKTALSGSIEIVPTLAEREAGLFSDIGLEKEIKRSIDRDGKVTDNASPELASLRGRYQSIHSQVHEVLAKLLESRKFQDVLQDEFFTLRNGRYVLPVKIEKKGTVEGIVHDISGSGQSLFVEPKEVTHLNNLLRTCELEIEREIFRILAAFSYRVSECADDLEQTVNGLAELDVVFAKARFSAMIGGHAPEINTKGEIDLRQVRHPMLIDGENPVVANNVALGRERAALIITGPNAGGKTVALKCVGICALMARAGMHLPADPDSKMSVFTRMFAVVGDEQSIAKNLSSFSAHILSLRYVLENLVPDSLVLIDEIGEGTEPAQGAALSAAVIEKMLTGRVRTVVTTHFPELTALGYISQGIANASVEFDAAAGAPTYHLIDGLPGKSSAFEVARRLGLADDVVERARAVITGGDQRLGEAIALLEKQRIETESLRVEAEQERNRAREEQQKQAELLRDLKKRKAKIVEQERDRVRQEFSQARAKIRATLRDLRKAPTAQKAATVRNEIRTVEKKLDREFPAIAVEPVATDEPQEKIADWSRIGKGGEVYVRSVRAFGMVDQLPDDRGMVRVIVSGAKMTLPADCCAMASGRQKKQEKKTSVTVAFEPGKSPGDVMREDRTVDLRGMTAEEALDRLGEYLDQSFSSRITEVFVVHGHGTGVLKRAVREYLRSSVYVKSFRPGERGEGGDGATVVDLDL